MNTSSLARPYSHDFEHMEDELRLLDLQIDNATRRLALLNAAEPGAQIERTAYISPEEVAWLLSAGQPALHDSTSAAVEDLIVALTHQIEQRLAASMQAGTDLALPRIIRLFGLSQFESRALMICFAPELHAKYDRLYAYMQDDITCRWPTVGLILNLLCDNDLDRWSTRRHFHDRGSLLRWRLLEAVGNPGTSGLTQQLRVDRRIGEYLLGDDRPDVRLSGIATMEGNADRSNNPAGDAIADALAGDARLSETERVCRGRVVYLQGPDAMTRRHHLKRSSADRPILTVDTTALLATSASESRELVRLAFREAQLQCAVLYLDPADPLIEQPAQHVLHFVKESAADFTGLVALGGESDWISAESINRGIVVETAQVPAPDRAERIAHWLRHLTGQLHDPAGCAQALADRYPLSTTQIASAVTTADATRRSSGRSELTLDDVALACRQQHPPRLSGLAVRVEPHYRWADLVLPESKIAQLHEICGQARHRHRVFEVWGFGSKIGHGTGLTALFSGPPGTGKTMAAEVVANDLGLPVYRIDLAGVVSKYIGETEKNLGRIFEQAHRSGAILFFDEADALFGKRTEVSDAHDRYANIETSYLLQKMDEYTGVVLLASNLRANLDDGFIRRLRCAVEFPFPDAVHRHLIWKSHVPEQAPIANNVDFEDLAQRYSVTGGSIKNILLNAASLAAADGGVITQGHIEHGTQREFGKLGKLWEEPTPTVKARI